jgi:hypothetical protein
VADLHLLALLSGVRKGAVAYPSLEWLIPHEVKVRLLFSGGKAEKFNGLVKDFKEFWELLTEAPKVVDESLEEFLEQVERDDRLSFGKGVAEKPGELQFLPQKVLAYERENCLFGGTEADSALILIGVDTERAELYLETVYEVVSSVAELFNCRSLAFGVVDVPGQKEFFKVYALLKREFKGGRDAT